MNVISHQKLAVAVLVVNHENKILLVKGYKRGWEFPGGYVGIHESIQIAGIREVKEESGISVQLTGFLGLEQFISSSTCVVILKGKPISGKMSLSTESQDLGYFSYEEAMKKITNKAFINRLIRCFDDQKIPFFIIN